jgi:hypothetical protein
VITGEADDYLVMPRLRQSAQLQARALAECRSVIAALGNLITADLWGSIVQAQPELRDHVAIPVDVDEAIEPARLLSEVLSVRADRLLVDSSVPCDGGWQFIVVQGIDRVGDEAAAAWMAWTARWARASHARRPTQGHLPPIFVCWRNQRTAGATPEADTALELHAVYRAISELDMRTLVRARGGGSHDEAQRWREHVLPPLVGNDLDLLEAVWEPCLGELTRLEAAVVERARARRWPPAGRRAGIAGPPRAHDELRGLAHTTPERGAEWNLAWAMANGDVLTFGRRLWRGQAGFLLPILDEVRFRIAERLEVLLGGDWAVRWPPRDDEEYRLVAQSHLHAQFGHMQAVLQEPHPAMFRRECGVLCQLVRVARQLRNELAHYRPVEFARYRELVQRATDAGVEVV